MKFREREEIKNRNVYSRIAYLYGQSLEEPVQTMYVLNIFEFLIGIDRLSKLNIKFETTIRTVYGMIYTCGLAFFFVVSIIAYDFNVYTSIIFDSCNSNI